MSYYRPVGLISIVGILFDPITGKNIRDGLEKPNLIRLLVLGLLREKYFINTIFYFNIFLQKRCAKREIGTKIITYNMTLVDDLTKCLTKFFYTNC